MIMIGEQFATINISLEGCQCEITLTFLCFNAWYLVNHIMADSWN